MICVHGVLVGLWLVLPIEVCVCVCLIRIARQLRACHKIHIIRLRYEVKKSTKSAFRVFILNQTHTHIHIFHPQTADAHLTVARGTSTMPNIMSL